MLIFGRLQRNIILGARKPMSSNRLAKIVTIFSHRNSCHIFRCNVFSVMQQVFHYSAFPCLPQKWKKNKDLEHATFQVARVERDRYNTEKSNMMYYHSSMILKVVLIHLLDSLLYSEAIYCIYMLSSHHRNCSQAFNISVNIDDRLIFYKTGIAQ